MNKDCTNCDKTLEEHGPDECNPFAGMTFEEIEAEQTAYWNKIGEEAAIEEAAWRRWHFDITDPRDERLWI